MKGGIKIGLVNRFLQFFQTLFYLFFSFLSLPFCCSFSRITYTYRPAPFLSNRGTANFDIVINSLKFFFYNLFSLRMEKKKTVHSLFPGSNCIINKVV